MFFDYIDYIAEDRLGYYVSQMDDSPVIVTSIGDSGEYTTLDNFKLPLRVEVPSEVALCLKLLRKLMNADDMFFIVHIRVANVFIILDKQDIAIGYVDLIDSISYQLRDGDLYEVNYNENVNGDGGYYLNMN